MTAFTSLILLIIIAALSMGVVAYSNFQEGKNKHTSQLLEKMKYRVEEIEDTVIALDKLCEKRIIPKLVNDEVIEHYEEMLQLRPEAGYLSAGLSTAQLRSNELSEQEGEREVSRVCKSDAEIARNTAYLNEALNILRKHHLNEKISANELSELSSDIEWLQLQIRVITNIAEGHKAYTKQDVLAANAFYKKAQTDLMKSPHPDKRRHTMISQLADVLFGRRKFLDPELMPETEFNPDSTLDNDSNNNTDVDSNEEPENNNASTDNQVATDTPEENAREDEKNTPTETQAEAGGNTATQKPKV